MHWDRARFLAYWPIDLAPVPDPRLTPHRGDVASIALEGQVEAAHFVEGVTHRVAVPVLDLRLEPDDAALATQLLFGEQFTVFGSDDARGLSWGQSAVDGYVGFVATHELEATEELGDLVVHAPFAQAYPVADIKSIPCHTLPFLARLSPSDGGDETGDFVKTNAGYVHQNHVQRQIDDPIAIAEQFSGAPYLWGGRSASGLDCSALVQLAALASGQACPRDSDMQWQGFGALIDDLETLTRGDMVFWAGHVGIMADSRTLLHANAYHMAVTAEPLENVAKRIDKLEGKPILGARRWPVRA